MHTFTVSYYVGTCTFFLQERLRSLLLKMSGPFTCTYTVLSTTIDVYGLSASQTHMLTHITACIVATFLVQRTTHVKF